MPPHSRSIFVSLLILLSSLGGKVLGAASLADGYAVRVWQTDDGLPQNMVTSAVQTRDGYLWFGTNGGLARFDGERFEVFDSGNTPSLPDRRITRLFEDARGQLWVGHESGMVSRFHDGRFESFSLPPGSLNDKIIGLGDDEDGRLWAMHEAGSIDAVEGSTRLPTLVSASRRPEVMSFSSRSGNIWLSQNGQAAQLANGRLSVAVLPPPRLANYVECVATSADGGVWIFCDGRVRKWHHDRWTEDRGPYPWSQGLVGCALELRDGTLAVGNITTGLYLLYPDGRHPVHFDLGNGLPQNWVRFLYEDREGNLWAGAGSAGLVSIHASAFSVLSLPEEAHGCSVLSVAGAADGSLWIGTDGANLYHYAAGEWERYGPEKGLANYYIPAVAVAPGGEVWASDFWWGGPYRLEHDRFVRPPGIEENANPVYSLLPIPGGEWLVGNRDGLRRWKDGHSTWLAEPHGSAAAEVCAIARDPAGVLWCGFTRGGLVRIADGRTTRFDRRDGLASDAISSLCIDNEGTLWVGTADQGLSRFKDGRFANLNRQHGLADNALCAILDDGRGYLWLSTHHGLQRIAKTELHRCADGASATFPSQVYDRNDGLPIIEFTNGFQSVATKTPDGKLWFASGKGVISADPARIEANPLPPPVVIDSLWTDGRR
ncbi:MAG TPA: two-component regulator propeller domain-containing protein, partial [Opitutus sp.]|nr:two-component regulator propeller domain-containing protein [Opitutus sp.]